MIPVDRGGGGSTPIFLKNESQRATGQFRTAWLRLRGSGGRRPARHWLASRATEEGVRLHELAFAAKLLHNHSLS